MGRFISFCKEHKKLMLALLFVVYFSLSYLVLRLLDTTCIFIYLFDIPCPGCGMTRALLSLLKFDIKSAFLYNPAIFFMPYIAYYIFGNPKAKWHKYILIITAIVLVSGWIFKLIALK